MSEGPLTAEERAPEPMPERIWVEAGRELCDDGSHAIDMLNVLDGPDPDADYPYQEVAEYVRADVVVAALLAETERLRDANMKAALALSAWLEMVGFRRDKEDEGAATLWAIVDHLRGSVSP